MPFKSKAQQRYMFSAEARGELKKGTARKWAKDTKDIKSLPEKAPMKKEAMFFKDRQVVEDGMFTKCAQSFVPNEQLPGAPKTQERPFPKPKPPPKIDIDDLSKGKPGKVTPINIPNQPGGTGGVRREGFRYEDPRISEQRKSDEHEAQKTPGYFKGANEEMGYGGDDAMMGTGESLEDTGKKLLQSGRKAGESVLEGGMRGLKGVAEDVPKYLESGMRSLEGLTDNQKAMLLAGAGLYGAHKLKKGVVGAAKALANRSAPKASGGMLQAAMKVLRRGR